MFWLTLEKIGRRNAMFWFPIHPWNLLHPCSLLEVVLLVWNFYAILIFEILCSKYQLNVITIWSFAGTLLMSFLKTGTCLVIFCCPVGNGEMLICQVDAVSIVYLTTRRKKAWDLLGRYLVLVRLLAMPLEVTNLNSHSPHADIRAWMDLGLFSSCKSIIFIFTFIRGWKALFTSY